ncbi:hypothetical protein GRF59_05445 [Paenibacillus sp. HJL G12]|uniref:Uncharacterized protein n=2 Tax=Paenibacillus dendrobii TaxID=2691084 RepID=A0A7X3IFQ7_9BACL|nr:hypothetical protein [Paenibacillus dendrobii]
MSHDLEFYAISVRIDSENFRDYWNLSVDGKEIMKNIHCMKYDEGLYFQVAHPILAGKEIVFEFNAVDGKARNIEVMFHFLTEPDIDLQSFGTTDLGSYPDPLPEIPDEEVPPSSEGGGVVLPVQWNLFKEVKDAEKWAANLGVKCEFGSNIDAANYVTEAIALLFNTCDGFAGMVAKYQLNINIKNGNGANGYFNPPANEVVVSKTYDFKHATEIARMEYDTHQKSSPNRLRTVIHEIGHWLHYHNVGASLFYQYSDLDPDAYGNQTILSKSDENYVANNLCQYATKWFPIELMPEVFTAKITGVSVDPKIWEWYEQYGGYQCSGW